jgi:hypothetical protein
VVFVFEVLDLCSFVVVITPPAEVQTHRTHFDNAPRAISQFSLTDNFDPGLSLPNI